MPLYEFKCLACGKKFTDLVGMIADQSPRICPHCGADQKQRLVSRFARYRSEDDRIDAIADELEATSDIDSPSKLRSMVREMGKAMDEDFSDEMEEMFESDMEGKTEDEF